jgi:hypothetical protein
MKLCTSCKETKPLSEYFKSSNTKSGLQGECKLCNSTRAKTWYRNNKERTKNNKLVKAYGITVSDFLTMLKKQNHKCGVCGTELMVDKSTCVDHCHTTGAVRGIVCTNCNLLLGHSKDSIEILKSAQKYLQKYSKKVVKK